MAISTKTEAFVLSYQKINLYPARGSREEQISRKILECIKILIFTYFMGKLTAVRGPFTDAYAQSLSVNCELDL